MTTEPKTPPLAVGTADPMNNLRRLAVRDAAAEQLARNAARRVADPQPSSPALVVAAFQSSL